MLVVNIGKIQENTAAMRARGLQNFAAKGQHFHSRAKIFLQLRVIYFQWLLSFQLRIVNHLKHWIVDFLSFETTYRMHKLNSRKYAKSGWHDCHLECFMLDFSLLPLLAFRICLWQRTSKLQFFMFLSFPFALSWIPKNSPQSWIALVIKKLSKHQNLTQFD